MSGESDAERESDADPARAEPDEGAHPAEVVGPDASAVPDDVRPDALLAVLRGIGASLFLTDHNLIVARDGANRRPRSGIQALPFDSIHHIRIELGTARSGRISVWTTGSQETVSVFFDGRSLDCAHELLNLARPMIARARRAGTRP